MKKTYENIDPSPVCERLKALRKQLGYENSSEFSSIIGVKPQTYINYENNRMPPGELFIELKRHFKHDVDIEWLLTGEKSTENRFVPEQIPTYGPNAELLKMTNEILNSNTEHADALTSNIRAFHLAVQDRVTLERRGRRKCDEPEKIPATGDRRKAVG